MSLPLITKFKSFWLIIEDQHCVNLIWTTQQTLSLYKNFPRSQTWCYFNHIFIILNQLWHGYNSIKFVTPNLAQSEGTNKLWYYKLEATRCTTAYMPCGSGSQPSMILKANTILGFHWMRVQFILHRTSLRLKNPIWMMN